jgi:two-component system, OmpR family, sensor histidine kinase KdpD
VQTKQASRDNLIMRKPTLNDQQARLLLANEETQNALINSVANDLRTPLVSIQGALSLLREDPLYLNDATRRSLIENAVEEAERLNRFISDLLDMARIEAHAIQVMLEPYDIEYIISSVVESQDHLHKDRHINIDIQSGIPLIPMDGVLIARALINVFDNAVKYSASGTPIDVQAWISGTNLKISVADRGIGILPDDLTCVFDKFYRVSRRDGVRGTGLGLAICKGIIEAHSGNIVAENREGGGTIFILTLPMAKRATGEVIESIKVM